MKTMDQVFAKEFKNMMDERRSMTGYFNLADIPVPPLPSLLTNLGKGDVCLVKGIQEPFFEKLNNTEVQLVTIPVLMKRQVLSDGSFRVDKDGNYVLIPVQVKQGFVAVYSNNSIGLRNKVVVNGVERLHTATDGFKYVDFFELNGQRRYIYIIPENNVYPMNLCALVITPNKHKNYYKGCRLVLQNGHYLYLYVIPFKVGRETRGDRVLGVKPSPDFNKEVKVLLDFWMSIGVIFNLRVTALEHQVVGETNLGITDLIRTLGPEDFIRINHSLGYKPSVDIENKK